MSKLFEKTNIGSMKLKNRLVRSATYEGMADENGFPTDDLFKLYERLARGGVGLIVTGYANVSPDGRSAGKWQIGIDKDEMVPKYRELVKLVHKNGCKIAMQIAHSGRQTSERVIGKKPMAPSAIFDKSTMEKPREMTEQDIEQVIEAFVQAARRVKESGFDAVQLHSAHGYLLSSFLCPHTNRRKDTWGGSIENRMRIISEIYTRCRKQLGKDYPILIKFSAYDNMKKGLKLEEGVIMAKMMADMGFDGIEVSCGIAEDGVTTIRGDFPSRVIADEIQMIGPNPVFRFFLRHFGKQIVKPVPFTKLYNLEAARLIKSNVTVPVFTVGGITELESMENIIENGDADFISLSRSLIREPKFPERLKKGSREESKCIHCNLCLYYVFIEPLRCYNGKRMKKFTDGG